MSAIPPTSGDSREKLMRVAKYQRWVIFALLANIAFMIVSFTVVSGMVTLPPGAVVVYRIIALAICVFMIYSVIMLAREFTNIVFAIGAGILMVVPLLSLLILLVFSQRATKYLRAQGIPVGFFGVNPNQI